jgi:hypothetical protein
MVNMSTRSYYPEEGISIAQGEDDCSLKINGVIYVFGESGYVMSGTIEKYYAQMSQLLPVLLQYSIATETKLKPIADSIKQKKVKGFFRGLFSQFKSEINFFAEMAVGNNALLSEYGMLQMVEKFCKAGKNFFRVRKAADPGFLNEIRVCDGILDEIIEHVATGQKYCRQILF